MNTQTIEKPTITVMRPPNPSLPATANGAEAKTIEAMPPREAISQGAVALVGRRFPPGMVRALLKITEEVGAIKKEGWNDFQKYHYQKWDDVLNALSPVLVRNGILITQSQMDSSISANDALLSITYSFTLIDGQTGECWPLDYRWTGIARLCDGKGVYDDKAANKCATQAHKYFVINLFKIATKESQDDDSDRGEARVERRPPDPSGKAQAPHALPIKEMSAENWAKLYLKNVKASASVAEVKEWRAQNEATLKKLEERFPEVFTDLCAELDALVGRLPQEATGTAVATTGRPRPPNPMGDQPAATTAANGIPDRLNRVDPPKIKARLLAKIMGFGDRKECMAYANQIEQDLIPLGKEDRAIVRGAFIERQKDMADED